MATVQEYKPKTRKVTIGYSNSALYGWQRQNQTALDIINQYNTRVNNGEWLSVEDRAKYKSAVDTYTSSGTALRNASKHYGTTYTDEEEKGWLDSLSSLNQGYSGINDFYNQFASDKEYGAWQTNEQKRKDFESVLAASDFAQNSAKKWNTVVNVNNALEYGDYKEAQGLRDKYMTETEWGIYNYYLNKGDTKKAEEYLAWNDGNLKQRAANKYYNAYDNTALELLFSATAGLDQFATGLRNVGNLVYGKQPLATPTSQYVSGAMAQNNTGVWKVANDLTQTLANQLPSIGVGMLTGGTMGGVTMGLSAAGNSYGDMVREGYDTNQARAYGIMTGASEFALSKVLGGISALGGNGNGIFQSIAEKVLPKINNAIGKIAIQTAGSMFDEALEEGVQTALEPVFKWAATLGEAEIDGIDWEEVGYSALLGGLSAGLLEGAPQVYNYSQLNKNAKDQYGGESKQIVAEALEIDPNDKYANALQAKLNKGKDVSGLDLYNIVKQTDSSKVKSAVATRLTELGEGGDVSTLAELITKESMGEGLSKKERATLESSKYATRVLNELNPENIKSSQYTSEWAESIGTRRLNADVYSRRPSTKVKTKDGAESTINNVRSVADGVATVELADGKVAKVGLDKGITSDVVFNDPKAENLFRIATDRVGKVDGWTTETANAMIKAYEGSTLDASVFARGWAEAYNIGRNNGSSAQVNNSSWATLLENKTRADAYNIGKAMATPKVMTPSTKTYKVLFDSSVDEGSLTNKQKTQIKALDVISKALGVNVVVFDSPMGADGKRVGKNGSYNASTRTVEIDLHAGVDGKGLMMFTAAHELTHHMREVASDKFNAYADAVFEALGENGRELVERRVSSLRASGRIDGKTDEEAYDLAFEEVVADSAERMLVDTDALAKLSESLKSKDKTLWEKVKDYIVELANKIKKIYASLEPDSQEAHMVSEMEDEIENIRKLWVEGIVEASKTADAERVDAETTHTQTKDVKHSDRDSIYLDAVNRGDMETAQRMVDEAAKKAGYNYHLYHGTDADFTKFDLLKYGGENGKGEGYGIYLAANREISAPYGKNVIDSYTKFNRLAEGREKTLSYNEVKKLVKRSCELEAKQMVDDEEYDSISEALKDTWVSNVVYTYNYSSIERVYAAVAQKLWQENDNDGDLINEIMALSGANYDYKNALKFYETVLTPTTRIDGFHYIWGNKDGSGEQNDIYLAFNSEQIKSADPVTYDDEGNVIPLSQRFNEENEDIRYSFRNSSSGMANDLLLPYDTELAKYIEQNNGYIVDSFDKLKKVVNLAFDNPNAKGTAYFGIINTDVLEKIKNSIPNLPQASKDILFKKGKDYSIATTLDSIRHIIDEKKLLREDVIDYLDRLADTIVMFDTVTFDYYYQGASKTPGLLFKKQFDDGTLVSFALVSHKKRSVVLQSLYLNSADYKKKKAAETLLMQNASAHTSKTQVGQPSTNSISQKSDLSTGNSKNSDRLPPEEAFSNRSLLANALLDTVQSDIEYKKLDDYKAVIGYLEAEEVKLADLKRKIYEATFGDGDKSKLKELREEARKTEARIDLHDKKLLQLESTTALKNVLERAKKQAYSKALEKGREAMHRNVESRRTSEIRSKIRKYKDNLIKTIEHPTERKYIPIDLVQSMIDVVDLIDTDTDLYKKNGEINKAQEKRNATKERLQKLRSEYENLKTNKDPLYAGEFDEAIYDYIKELQDNYSDKSINDMSLIELTEMYEILQAINETLLDARKLIGWTEGTTVIEAGDTIIAEQDEIRKARKDGKRNTAAKAKDAVIDLSLSPVRNVERMSGYNDDSPLVKLFYGFVEGVRKKNFFVMTSYRMFEKLTTGENQTVFEDARYKEFGEEMTDSQGRKFKVSKMQMMQAILSYERETANNQHHIEYGGFTFANLKLLSKGNIQQAISSENSHRVGNGEFIVHSFIKQLAGDKWCQDYMKMARKFFNESAKDAVNEATIALKHRIVARDSNYIPFEVDKNFVVSEITEDSIQQTISSYGVLKDVNKQSAQPLIMTGLDNVIDRHIEQVGNIYGLAVPIRNFNKVWNVHSHTETLGGSGSVKDAVEAAWGKSGTKVITQTVRDLQGSRTVDNPDVYNAYNTIKGNVIGATFKLNLSVVTKQIGSLFTATSMLDWRNPASMLINLLDTMKNHDTISAEVDKYTATAWMRRQGLSDAELHTLATEGQKSKLKRWSNKLPTVISPDKWITGMDSMVALSLWKYAKEDVAKRTNLKGQALLEETAKFYDELVENTQSMSDVLHRPEVQRSKNILLETLSMFKTDLYQMAGQLQVAYGRYQASNSEENGKALAKTVGSVLMSTMWGALMTTLWALVRYKVNPYRDDEDDELTIESWLSRQGVAVVADLVGYVVPLFGSEAVGIIERIWTGETEDVADSLVLSAVNDVVSAIEGVANSAVEGEFPKEEAFKGLLTKVCGLFGVPVSNILRIIEAIKLHGEDIANKEFLSFEAGLTKPNSTRLYNAYIERDPVKIERASRLYEDQKEIESALRKAIRDNDPRLEEAALARLNGDRDTYYRLMMDVIDEGNFDKQIIKDAFDAEYNYQKKKAEENK